MDADRLQLGARVLDSGTAEFVVWAPRAKRVEVRLLGNPDRLVALAPCGNGYFSATVDDAGPGTRYFYWLDGRLERPDPAARFQPEGVHGPSEIIAQDVRLARLALARLAAGGLRAL